MKTPLCIQLNRSRATQLIALTKTMIESMGNAMPEHNRDEMEAAIQGAYGDLRKLLGGFIGMTLALDSENPKVNALAEDFIAKGGDHRAITDGMQVMIKERDKTRSAQEAAQIHDLAHSRRVAELQCALDELNGAADE